MKRYQKFLVFWIVNAALLYLANMLMPRSVALGNSIFKPYQAVVFSAFIWDFVLWYTEPVLKDMELATKSPMAMMVNYLAINFATLWFIARFSFITGIGIGSFVQVLVLAIVGNFVQYAAWQYMDKKK
ncbi:MAG: hypothetical protein UT61_C0067G0004 [Candidatus Woesebacteria bacterium GW2011_GWA1_39_8]|uniref:Uncharacterized protein n=1 Tax=Candidatus Woesebacteria bacterium GW2011_GWA1_39_8 TaxID=1618552 RepID=A0A0G0PIM9_9BACT|nr:MAG: hypothetical protein UT61_C0067G0004 [Candidatus Woesebacteria bacterium GW2011_GWA1_39_8]